MCNVRIELDHDGMRALLQSEEIQSVLEQVAQSRLSGVSGNFETEVEVLPTRAVARIKPADAKTYYSNLKHNTLLKAIK